MICLGMNTFGFILFGVRSASWTYRFMSFPKFMWFSAIGFSNTLSPIHFLLSFWDSSDPVVNIFLLQPHLTFWVLKRVWALLKFSSLAVLWYHSPGKGGHCLITDRERRTSRGHLLASLQGPPSTMRVGCLWLLGRSGGPGSPPALCWPMAVS